MMKKEVDVEEMSGEERKGGNEQRSMNSAELTDHNSSTNTHTHNLARGREIKSYLEPYGRREKREEEDVEETKERDEKWNGWQRCSQGVTGKRSTERF